MSRVCIINVVGLTPKLLQHAPRIAALGAPIAWRSPLPAVTSTSQATMLTGLTPRDHGIVANGWYFRDTQEIRFWQQANSLIQGDKFYDGIDTAENVLVVQSIIGCKLQRHSQTSLWLRRLEGF